VRSGIWFLGYRVFPTHRLRPKQNVRQMQQDHTTRRLDWPAVVQRLMSWVGHAEQADSSGCGSGCSLQSISSGRRAGSRVLRGGSFSLNASYVRSAYRNTNAPSNRNNNLARRLARAPPELRSQPTEPTAFPVLVRPMRTGQNPSAPPGPGSASERSGRCYFSAAMIAVLKTHHVRRQPVPLETVCFRRSAAAQQHKP
jgi:hypothetical protein